MLFDKAIEMFMENCVSRDLSPNTIEKYKNCLCQFSGFLGELYNRPVYINEVKAEDMERFLFQHYNSKDYSTSSRHNVITAFHSMYSYLERKRLCENKGKLVRHEKVETAEREIIDELEFRRIVKHINSATAKAVVCTLYYSGLRINEAISLKMADVDLEQDVFHIKETKTKEDRTVPINASLKRVLLEYMQNGRIDCRTDYFFSTYPKGQISSQQVNRQLNKALTRAGIKKKITNHSFRHSFTSYLIQKGVDLVTLRQLLGHQSVTTTSGYCHTTQEQLAEAVNVL